MEERYGQMTNHSTGTSEDDISYNRQAIFHDKNYGKFIPINTFNEEQLPSDYKENDIVDLVRSMSDLTVRVSVRYTSADRPETVPRSDKPYPYYSDRGSYVTRQGTGWVKAVQKFPRKFDRNKACECKECLNSLTPKKRFGRIQIKTAAHVVFDEKEASHTTCHLFFDEGDTPDVCSGVVTLREMSGLLGDVEKDYYIMTYITHDLNLVQRLDTMIRRFNNLKKGIRKTYGRIKFSMASGIVGFNITKDILTIAPAHPYGYSKQVSVEQHNSKHNFTDWTQNANTGTKTCQGSGGALMLVIELKKEIKLNKSERVTFVLLVIAGFVCFINGVLTILYLKGNCHTEQDLLDHENTQPEICIDCIKLNENHDSSSVADPQFNMFEKKWVNGVQKCCTTTLETVNTMFEMINIKGDYRAKTSDIIFTITPIYAHKQLHAPVGGDNLTEPEFNEGHNVALLISDKVDPILEHARGVTVTNDSLIIQYPGLYYIYSSAYYMPVSDRPANEFQHQNWFHYVHRTSTTNPDNSGTLLQTAHSVCDNCTKNEETAFTGGTFYLEMGDEIQVCYSSLGLVQFSRESTFVGLMILESGSSE